MTPHELTAGAPVEVRVRVADEVLPDAVNLWIRAAGARSFGEAIPMNRSRGNDLLRLCSTLSAWVPYGHLSRQSSRVF